MPIIEEPIIDGGGEPQTSVLTGIDSFYTKDETNSVLVRDFCPIYADCTSESLDGLTKSSVKLAGTPKWTGGNVDLGILGTQYCRPDNWVVQHTLPYRQSNITRYWCRRGYKPQFTNQTSILTSANNLGSHTVYIRKYSSYLEISIDIDGVITPYQYNASFFKDRVVPERLILLLQGAGGGGGSADTYAGGGGGGGSGGFIYAILNLSYTTTGTFIIYVGAPGTGGSSIQNGTNGGLTTLKFKQDGYDEVLLLEIYGGQGGLKSGASGSGGAIYSSSWLDTYFYFSYILSNVSGNTVGVSGGNESSAGQNMSAKVLTATNYYPDIVGINNKSLSAKSGGAGNVGGGGGASVFANGGTGGTTTGGVGSKGSGGGGGKRYSAGGKGGSVHYEFYY